ncbi:MAG: SUMF1/EgtB/PvdO family nonheme iron enzyme [Planctomycetota bacterium]|jgi:formylglycine-generating enzyme required for sulfatase activity
MKTGRSGSPHSKLQIHALILAFSLLLAGQSTGSQKNRHTEPQPGGPFDKALKDLEMINTEALRRAVNDLARSFPDEHTDSRDYLGAIDSMETDLPTTRSALLRREAKALKTVADMLALQRKVLLANPLLNFDGLLLIKRKPLGDPRRSHEPVRGIGKFVGMPQQSSWQLHTMKNTDGWDNEICVLSPPRNGGRISTVYRPSNGRLVSEMDLHFDAEKVMFSMPDEGKLWQVYEVDVDGENLRRLSPGDQIDVHNFDSCYLPNDKIAFVSTAPFQGVPCNASVNVGMTYLMDSDGSNVRQLCFEQDHNFCPTVMNDGRIVYLRWEYTDIPHVWARFLFTMNPDGTGQREYYGSGGYWPNAIFFARPVPDHPTKVVGIVTGHHVGRVGELVVFDPALGRNAADGVVQRIPGFGKRVEPLIEDKLAMESWPKFLHPWPLSDKYFLVACKPRPRDLWGIYLVDVFDNILLLKEVEGYALLEPIPLRRIKRPPLITDRIDLSRKDALVYLENIYEGPGLQGVPHGAVKQLRLFTYHFAYHRVAGINHRVGADGPWEPKRVLGTVPVEPDGSAMFRIPANTPVSIQPIDADGKALQLMRSWMTAMPGEIVSCIGCHEKQNAGPPNQKTIAALRPASEIEPWYGPSRGFSFRREVQPVLDRYCISCHDGADRNDERQIPDLRANQGRHFAYRNGDSRARIIEGIPREDLLRRYGGVFDPSYITLRSFVRVGGLESDLRLLWPGEFCADTTELVQMLMKGHHGVRLDAEAWHRIFAWIDLNAPAHGTWREVVGIEKTRRDHKRRLDLRRLYGGSVEDPEVYPAMARAQIVPTKPRPMSKSEVTVPRLSEWPFGEAEARRRQESAGAVRKVIGLGDNLAMELVRVPAGTFVMGDANGDHDEQPLSTVKIARPFWMSKFEITNAMYSLFDPSHDSKYEHKASWMFNEWDLGWDLNGPHQPVIRVSWKEATAFCRWLSERTGLKVSLPTEAQWEWACRAGTDSPLNYGDPDTDFSAVANMADFTMHELVYDARNQFSPDLVPRDARFDDEELVATNVGSYLPNRWGLYDMHGNVWEWTRSSYRRYPYDSGDGRNDATDPGRKVVRGGSWYDRPKRCRSAFRLSYPGWRKVYNVGFRIVVESSEAAPKFVKSE